MKTAIVFASKHGTTAKVAHMIKNGLEFNSTDIFNLKVTSKIDLSKYDCVILGGSMHAGTVQKSLKKFYTKHLDELIEKKLGLFLCCMDETQYESQFDNSFPEILRKHAKSRKIVGGEFLFDKMNFIERFIIKHSGHYDGTDSTLDERKINELINELKNS